MSSSPLPDHRPCIRVLPEELANQIAAGEVVERPASVVKELVENAIDAGAGRIHIEIEGAGKKLIRVTDNGAGMPPEDARLAFARHATSKIGKPEDLAAIDTLGFRGEALASIASIARVRLLTTSDERHAGTEVTMEGGSLLGVRDAACPRGTAVEVRDLFFNTPARKKFQKGDTTEAAHITQVVTQQALIHPSVQITLLHNGRQVVNALPTEHTLYRIAELFGAEITRELVRVEARDGDYRLEGYVSNPVYTRSNRSAQYFFVNRRCVRDKVVLHATQQGYSHLLPKDQHAVLFLYLSMPPHLLDVNVHPAKAEVRFAFQQEVHRFIVDALRSALGRNEKTPPPGGEEGQSVAATPPSPFQPAPLSGQPKPYQIFRPVAAAGRKSGDPVPPRPASQAGGAAARPLVYSREQHRDLAGALGQLYGKSDGGETPLGAQMDIFDRKPSPFSRLGYADFQPLGQLNNSFIVLQGKRGMVVVDQHVAHERVLYERFRAAAANKKIEVQSLLFPLPLELPPGEAQLVAAHLDWLRGLGMELEPFGNNSFLLRAVPAMMKSDDYAQVFRDIVDALPRQGSEEELRKKHEEIIIMMACRNAIKVNQPLDPDQIKKLLFDLEQTQMPYTCPHGRPIALFFDIEDILKKFLRT